MKLKWQPKVGDHCGIYYYSDVHPATVIKRTPKFVWIQDCLLYTSDAADDW